ncbi:MAG: hypothetical protein AAF517_26970 [Planctomycetota bacterium]
MQLPLRVFASAENFQNMWDLFLDRDPASHDGLLYFIEAGFGAVYNGGVPLWVDGVRQGDFFESSVGLSSSATSGLEYSWKNISIRGAIILRAANGFDSGDSGFNSDAGGFQSVGGMFSLALKF